MKQYTIGVDLGGTKIAAGLVDARQKIVEQVSCPTDLPQPEEKIEHKIVELCRRLAATIGISLESDVEWVGIGTPGSVNPHTGIV